MYQMHTDNWSDIACSSKKYPCRAFAVPGADFGCTSRHGSFTASLHTLIRVYNTYAAYMNIQSVIVGGDITYVGDDRGKWLRYSHLKEIVDI